MTTTHYTYKCQYFNSLISSDITMQTVTLSDQLQWNPLQLHYFINMLYGQYDTEINKLNKCLRTKHAHKLLYRVGDLYTEDDNVSTVTYVDDDYIKIRNANNQTQDRDNNKVFIRTDDGTQLLLKPLIELAIYFDATDMLKQLQHLAVELVRDVRRGGAQLKFDCLAFTDIYTQLTELRTACMNSFLEYPWSLKGRDVSINTIKSIKSTTMGQIWKDHMSDM